MNSRKRHTRLGVLLGVVAVLAGLVLESSCYYQNGSGKTVYINPSEVFDLKPTSNRPRDSVKSWACRPSPNW